MNYQDALSNIHNFFMTNPLGQQIYVDMKFNLMKQSVVCRLLGLYDQKAGETKLEWMQRMFPEFNIITK